MVATTLSGTSTGPRPIDLQNDLGQLADLLEICFSGELDQSGRALVRELRMIGKGGGVMGFLSGVDRLLGNLQQGFVWTEDGTLIGNATVSPAMIPPEFGRGSILSNVAVLPNYRTHGVAGQLVDRCIEMCRAKADRFILLQVNTANATAHHLYERRGFRSERAFTRWVRSANHAAPFPDRATPPLWLLPVDEWRAALALAEAVRPNHEGGMGWLRPTAAGLFRPGMLARLVRMFSGTTLETYVAYRDEKARGRGGLRAALRLQSSFGTADRADLLVSPLERGKLEAPLINYLLRRLESRRRSLVIEHPADDEAAAAALRQNHFEPKHTLLTMRLDLDEG